MKQINRILIILALACIFLASTASLFTGKAEGYANFTKWANRSARVLEPADYNTNGTCSCAICCWKGVQGIGNLGIGDGNVSLMKPGAINEKVTDSKQAKNASETPENYSGNVIRAPDENKTGNGTLVTKNEEPQPVEPEVAADAPLTETLYPDYDLAASVIPRLSPYSITINQPFAHILSEDPCEAAALYGKLVGVPMPGGQIVDVGVKSIGYEY